MLIHTATVAVISLCSFSSNNATWGGAINYYMNHNSLTLADSTLEQNSASITGGGLVGNGIGKVRGCDLVSKWLLA